MEYFGLFSFIMVIALMGRVRRLERILRENGIASKGATGLSEQLSRQVGQVVTLSLETGDGDFVGRPCKVLDVDEHWALVLVNEGKKAECEKLIRLENVKQIKVG